MPRCSALALVLVLGAATSGCLGVEQSFDSPPTLAPAARTESANIAATVESGGEIPDEAAAAMDAAQDSGQDQEGGDADAQLRVGALLALSGSASSFGEKGEAALELAVEHVNAAFVDRLEVAVRVEDSATDPETALAALERLHDEGIRIVVGPQTSANTAAVMDFAAANEMILISPSSVARELAIPDDNVFRMTPDDTLQTAAMSTMLLEDGLESLFIVHRDDLWGDDLAKEVKTRLESSSDMAIDVRSYPTRDADYDAMLGRLTQDVALAVAEHDIESVGIYLLSFGEAASILSTASSYDGLDSLRWYGSSAVAQSEDLLSDLEAARFAESVGFPSPVFGLDPDTKLRWEPLRDEIAERTGQTADIYALAAYDALWLAAQAYLDLGPLPPDEDLASALKMQLPRSAADMLGVTGPLRMNDAGDRATGNSDFWALAVDAEQPAWARVAVFDSETGTLTRSEEQP